MAIARNRQVRLTKVPSLNTEVPELSLYLNWLELLRWWGAALALQQSKWSLQVQVDLLGCLRTRILSLLVTKSSDSVLQKHCRLSALTGRIQRLRFDCPERFGHSCLTHIRKLRYFRLEPGSDSDQLQLRLLASKPVKLPRSDRQQS